MVVVPGIAQHPEKDQISLLVVNVYTDWKTQHLGYLYSIYLLH